MRWLTICAPAERSSFDSAAVALPLSKCTDPASDQESHLTERGVHLACCLELGRDSQDEGRGWAPDLARQPETLKQRRGSRACDIGASSRATYAAARGTTYRTHHTTAA
jgi:hypothetical protein